MKKQNFNKRKNSKHSLAFLAGVSILFLVMLVGLSYAFLSQVLKGEKENTVTAGTLAIEYKDKKTINLDNIYPMSDTRGMETSSYEFSVENTGDVKAIYDISLEEDKSTMNHSYLKYALKRNDEEWSEPKVLDSLKLRDNIELEVGSKDNYELKLWMDENIGNEGQNKVFKARVVISSVQSNATAKDITPPVIKLKGSLSENIQQNSEYTDPGVESVVDDKDTLDKNNITLSYEYYDGETTSKVETIDTSKLGVYYITYQITDKNGNIGKVIRSVNIYKKNTTPPVIRLNGKSLMAIKTGEEYTELGASVTSGEKDLTSRIVTVGKVNNKKAGSYEIKYLITDNDGNTASIVRIVNVIHINSDFKADITLDLTDKPTDKIKIEGENLGDITYTSGDPDIVTVDENGNITGKNPGTTTITIKTSTGHEESITVTITKTIHITYEKSTGIKNIGKTSDTCKITEKGGSCRITLPSAEGEKGYQVSGWYEAEEKVGDASSTVEVTSDKTYTAKAVANTYTIVYHANGGSGSMASTTATTGKSVSISSNSFTKEGHTFAGWTTNSNGEDDNNNWTSWSGTWNYDNGEKGIQNNTLNLYARWSINSYDVTYDYATNGGSSASKTTAKVNYNSAIDLTPSASKSGWTFVGWNTNKDATSALTSLTMKTSKVTLYAIYRKEAITYTVYFDANGNTIDATSKSCTIPAVYNNAKQEASCDIQNTPTITAPSATPRVIGYNQDKSATSSQVGSNAKLTVTSSINGKKYFAITTKDAVTRTVTYEKETGVSAIGKDRDSCTIGATYNGVSQATSCNVTLPSITASKGYTTDKWYKGQETTGTVAGTSVSLSSNATYTAKATANTYTIAYHANGGSGSMASTTATTGKNASISANSFTKEGYTFAGWTTNSNGTDDGHGWTNWTGTWKYDNGEYGITSNKLTLYARWTINSYDVAYDYAANGGSSATKTTAKVNYNSAIDLTPSATKSGWTFVGWNTNKDATSALSSLTMKTSKVTLYAIYRKEAITRTVTYEKGTGVSAIGKTSDSCTIGAVYNNATQGTSCNVTLPSITSLTGYNTGFWATSSTATSGTAAGTSVSLSGNVTYHARALDTTKPVWSLISTTPSSGSSGTITITFKGTDTSGSATSTLSASNITVKVGGSTDSSVTKTLSSASNVTNGKQYTLTLSSFSIKGIVSITIAANTLSDASNNKNVECNLTTGVTSLIPLSTALIQKANSAGNTDGATATQLHQPFTVNHAVSGWTSDQALPDYRYMGTDPYNYIKFNDETWRIIGVHTLNNEKRVKIILGAASVGGAHYPFSVKEAPTSYYTYIGISHWQFADLSELLNSGPYYNRTLGTCVTGIGKTDSCNFSHIGLTTEAKNLIDDAPWYLGAIGSASTASDLYVKERRNSSIVLDDTTFPSSAYLKVGLMYPSDYGYAAGSSSCLSTSLSKYSTSCKDNNWLRPTYNNWLITPGDALFSVSELSSNGNVSYSSSPTNTSGYRPTVYLKANVVVTAGDGSSSSPYQISL